jgi:outer membrane lipopolysaccharide assembly protein LptE/RlpB
VSRVKYILTLTSLALIFLIVSGCGVYTFSGAVPGHLKSIAVPPFENQTAEFGLAEDLSAALIDEFLDDNSFKVLDLRQADAVIYGTIVRIHDAPSTYSSNESVQEYKVTITARVRYEDLVKGKIIWDETISSFGTFPTGGGLAERAEGIDEAVKKLTEDILNKTVSGW